MQQALADFEHVKYSACPKKKKKKSRHILSSVKLEPQLYPIQVTEPATLMHKATSKARQDILSLPPIAFAPQRNSLRVKPRHNVEENGVTSGETPSVEQKKGRTAPFQLLPPDWLLC